MRSVGFTNCQVCENVVTVSCVSDYARIGLRMVKIFFVCDWCHDEGGLLLDARVWAQYLGQEFLESQVAGFAEALEPVRFLSDLELI